MVRQTRAQITKRILRRGTEFKRNGRNLIRLRPSDSLLICPSGCVHASGQQAVDSEYGLAADIDLGVRHCRDSELHREAGSTGTAGGAAVKHGADVGGIVSVQDSRGVGLPAVVIN